MLGGVILMGILASVLPVTAAMILHGLIQLTSNGYRAWLNRKDIQWTITGLFALGAGVTMGGLSFVAFTPDRITVLLALGLLPFIAVALPASLVLDITRKPMAVLAGVVVVACNLLAGVGGPLLDVFFQRVAQRVVLTRHQVVATKAVVQSLGHISKIVFFGVLAANISPNNGADDWSNNWPSMGLLAFAIAASVIGTTAGKRVLDTMDDKVFFTWTQRILLTLGAIFIARAVYLMSL